MMQLSRQEGAELISYITMSAGMVLVTSYTDPWNKDARLLVWEAAKLLRSLVEYEGAEARSEEAKAVMIAVLCDWSGKTANQYRDLGSHMCGVLDANALLLAVASILEDLAEAYLGFEDVEPEEVEIAQQYLESFWFEMSFESIAAISKPIRGLA